MSASAPSRAGGRRDVLLVLTAGVCWGTAGVAGSALGSRAGLSPLAVGWYRLAVATVLLVGLRVVAGRAPLPRVGRDLPRVAAVGVLLAVYQVSFFAAVARAGVGPATLVTLGAAPVLVALAGLRRGRPSATLLAALASALAGLALLVGVPSGGAPGARLAGSAFALTSAAGYAGVTLLSRGLAGRVAAGDLTVLGFSVGTLAALPLAATAGLSPAPDLGVLALLLYLGAVPTALAYGLFFAGLRTTGATAAAVLTLVEPLTAAVLAALLVGERLGPAGLAGSALLLGAVVALALDPAATD